MPIDAGAQGIVQRREKAWPATTLSRHISSPNSAITCSHVTKTLSFGRRSQSRSRYWHPYAGDGRTAIKEDGLDKSSQMQLLLKYALDDSSLAVFRCARGKNGPLPRTHCKPQILMH